MNRPPRDRATSASRRTVAAALLGAAVVTVTACSSGGGPAAGTSATSGGPTTSTGPLDEFLTGPTFSPEDQQAKERQVQDLIVTCMAAEGFEYRPFAPSMATYSTDDGPQWGTKEFAAKYGYGITVNGPWATTTPTTDQPVDPNQSIVDAMGDGEREAYFEALYGTASMATSSAVESVDTSDGESAPVSVTDVTPTSLAGTSADPTGAASESAGSAEVTTAQAVPSMDGCWNTASNQVYGVGQRTDEFSDLMNRMSQVWEQAQQDPEVGEAQDRWAACLADAGHPGFTSIDQPQQQIIDRSNAFYQSLPQPEPTQTSFDEAAASSAMAAVTASPDYAALQADEIALAVADAECKETVGYQQVVDEVTRRLQQQFVDDNRAELEQYRDALNGGG